ncbi:conserved unknown protein [Ectocarpus siliculosus]|uniref:Store-operated calcium entry-associated regulatory factor n=1 Tax=Ectocarpus siliculosus TaxID=2880 RepID=D7FTF2_ECTSI|nr:conserved unknown protein [Ectocarpus siliculosus]|eukprot:CBJ48530.1 conserved unknown protein [Ectocarpus siliculosus]
MADRVLLSDVNILTFTRSKKTTHRRVPAVQQLICDDSGPAGCPNKKEYLFEYATCENEGIGENMMPSWSCTASSLPKDTELGSVNVSCEGYTYGDDPYVLAGSCAMEYTLTGPTPQRKGGPLADLRLLQCLYGPFAAFMIAFLGLFACCACSNNKRGRAPRVGAAAAAANVTGPGGIPTATAVHLDDVEKNASSKAGGSTTAHAVGTPVGAGGPVDHKPSESRPLLAGSGATGGGSWWNRGRPTRGGLPANSTTYQGATTSGRGDSDGGHHSTAAGGTTGRGDDHTSTAHGGTSGRGGGGGGGGVFGGLFGGGGGGGGGSHSSTASGGTTGRSGGSGGGHSSSASGGTSGR